MVGSPHLPFTVCGRCAIIALDFLEWHRRAGHYSLGGPKPVPLVSPPIQGGVGAAKDETISPLEEAEGCQL